MTPSDRSNEKSAVDAAYKLAAIIESSRDAIIGLDLKGIIQTWNPGAEALYGFTAKEVIGKSIMITVPPNRSSEFWRGLEQVGCGGRAEYETRRIRKDGALIDVWVIVSPIKDAEGRIVGISGIIRNIGERKRRDNEIRLLQAFTQAIHEKKTLEEALAVALQNVCEITGWDLGQAWAPTADKTALKSIAAWHRARDRALNDFVKGTEDLMLAPGVGIPGRVWVTKKPEWVADIQSNPLFIRTRAASRAGLKGFMAVPILVKEEVTAIIEFFMRQSSPDDKDYLNLVEVVSSGLGASLERKWAEEARLVGKHLIDVAEKERRAVARELHDSVNQILASAKYRVQVLGAKLCDISGSIDPDMVKAVKMLNEAMQEVRRISQNLQPVVLDELGLISAVRSFCSEFGSRTGTQVRFNHENIVKRLDPNVEITLFRIIQEIFNNIEKHSFAREVQVQLTKNGKRLTLMVQDDGKGFQVDKNKRSRARKTSLGLLNMRERAAFIGGQLELYSMPGKGTKITIEVPLTS